MILVTGASGTVGSEVVRGLQKLGAGFTVGYRGRRPEGLPGVAIDFDRPETLAPALAGIETLFLLSNQVAPEANAVRAASSAGVKRIVKLSVWGALDEAFTFAKWHRAIEREIEASGLAFTFLRPNGFMQNVIHYMGASIKGQNAIFQPAEDARVSHIDARDIGAVAARVLTGAGHDGKGYSLSGPEALSYGDMAATLSRVLGREIRYVKISDDDYKKGAMTAGMPEAYAEALLNLVRYYRTGGIASKITGDVKAVTGADPIRFEQFAKDHATALL